MWVQSLGGEDPLEKEMAARSSILALQIPWTEEPGRLQSMRFKELCVYTHTYTHTEVEAKVAQRFSCVKFYCIEFSRGF